MKILNACKKILTGIIGLIFTFPLVARTEDNHKTMEKGSSLKKEQLMRETFSKEELIDALRKMNRHPENIKVICAMCYKTVMPSKEIEFQCDKCGRVTVYPREVGSYRPDQIEAGGNGNNKRPQPGILSEKVSFIKRSLTQMPYKISVDSTGLCSVCGKEKDKVLLMAVSCFNCGREFSWEVKDEKDINMFKWLFLKLPVTEIDGIDLDVRGDEKKAIKQGAEYINTHVFCPDCRKQNNVTR